MPREHGREVATAAVHLLEDLLVEAVEAHGEPLQPCGLELHRVLREPRGVGGERDVLDALEGAERSHDLDDIAPQQRLAAREPDLLDAELREQAFYKGKVVKVMEFGAFVNFFGPKDGLVHISQLTQGRPETVGEVVEGRPGGLRQAAGL